MTIVLFETIFLKKEINYYNKTEVIWDEVIVSLKSMYIFDILIRVPVMTGNNIGHSITNKNTIHSSCNDAFWVK